MTPSSILISASGSLDSQIGGGQVYVQNLSLELQHRKHRVAVISPQKWTEDQKPFCITKRDFKGIPVYDISINPKTASHGDWASDTVQDLQHALRGVFDNFKPDLAHINGWVTPLVKVCKEKGIPHVATAHHPGEACPNGSLLTPEDTICSAIPSPKMCVPCNCRQKKGGGFLSETLASIPPWLYRPLGSFLNRFSNKTYAGRVLMYPWLVERKLTSLRYFHKNAQKIIAPSQAIARILIHNGVARERVAVIPHGIRPLTPCPIPPLKGRPVRFGFIGRVDRAKGLHVLIRAWKALPKDLLCELHIIGDAQNPWDKTYFERCLVHSHTTGNVILHGRVDHSQIGDKLAQIDVLILPAIYLEVFGLVILEAFSVRRPVIVTNCGGPPELVRDGIDGLLVEPNNPEALAEAIQDLSNNPERIIQMSHNIQAVRTLEEHANELESIYVKVIESKSK